MQTNGIGSYKNSDKYAKFGPKLVGPLPGPKAKAVVDADTKWLSPSYTRSYPLVAKRGRGMRVEDVDWRVFSSEFARLMGGLHDRSNMARDGSQFEG